LTIEHIIKNILKLYPCCDFWTVPIAALPIREKAFFTTFSPSAKTAIVLGHHILTRDEWKWYATADGGEYCAADDHTRNMCNEIAVTLEKRSFRTKIVPYPGESGLQFRFVAQEAGAGIIGMNAFLLHPLWGPWIHLRVMTSEAPNSIISIQCTPVCNECGACISSCPAGAIQATAFDGLQCRGYRQTKEEYIPYGPQQELRYCEICAEVCPIGEKPAS
jgi:epoxyqueuosine reductase